MKMRDLLRFEKENMPEFQWKFEKFLIVFLTVWLGGAILTLIISIIIGSVSGESGGLWYVPLIVWGCVLAVCLVVLVIKSIKLKSQLIQYYTEKLSRKFYKIDYLKVKKKLIDDKQITDNGFLVEPDEIIPFEQAEIIFNPHFFGGKLIFELILKDEIDWIAILHLDNIYCNFLIYNMHIIQNKNLFQLFNTDKETFIKLLLRYKDASKIEKKLNLNN